MGQGSGLTRGDRRRNARVEGLRAVVRADRAILSIDLGEDKQVAALLDHHGRVLGRKVITKKAHALGGLLDWAAAQASRQGFAGVPRSRRAASPWVQRVVATPRSGGVGWDGHKAGRLWQVGYRCGRRVGRRGKDDVWRRAWVFVT